MPDQNVTAADHEIVVIGAGFGGIAMAVKLREAGIDDFVILERAAALGGTWRDNTYPGCACDVPSQLYSYSFAQNPDWTRTYGKQEEILAYLHQVADRYDVKRHIWYEVEMLGAQWNEADRMWTLETSAGTVTARVVVTAAGVYGEAKYPRHPGPGHLHRHRVPLAALGPLVRPDGRSDRRHRDRGPRPSSSSPPNCRRRRGGCWSSSGPRHGSSPPGWIGSPPGSSAS